MTDDKTGWTDAGGTVDRIAETIGPYVVQAPPGVPVASLIARGDVELGFQQLSELMHLEGIDVIGPMPPGLEIVTTFSGGVCTASTQANAARALLDRIGPSGLGELLQDLVAGQTMEQAIERFGVTFAAFESDLERRVGAKRR